MEKSKSLSLSISQQDLWSEIASSVLYLSEIIWFSAVFCVLFNYPFQTFRIGSIVGLLGFGGYFLARFLLIFKAKKNLLPIAFGIWIVLSILSFLKIIIYANTSLTLFEMVIEPFAKLTAATALQSQLWQLIGLVFILRRSFTLASSSPHTWRAVRSFQVGMLMFLLYGLTTAWSHIFENLAPFLIYLLAILLAMSTSRLSELLSNQGSRTEVFKKSWLLGMLTLALFTVIIGSLIGCLVGITFVNFTAQILRFVYSVGIAFILLLFSPLIALFALLIPWLNDLIAKIADSQIGLKQLEFIQSLNQPDPEQAARLTEQVNKGLVFVLLAILLVITIFAMIGVRNHRQKNRTSGKDELENLVMEQTAKGKLKFRSNLFHSAYDKALRWLAAARIRRIYQQLMEYCEKLDRPRLPACTPIEFLPQLVDLFPEFKLELGQITNAYLNVRYGEIPENIDEMRALYDSWTSIKTVAEGRIKERKKKLMMR